MEMQETEWHCQNCDMQTILTSIEKLQHQQSCTKTLPKDTEKRADIAKRKPNTQAYECPDCRQTSYLTPIEILKHKKSHVK